MARHFDKSLALAIVEVVVRKNQIEITGRQGYPSRRQTRNNRDMMRTQELLCDLLCKDRVVLKVENVHGARDATIAPNVCLLI